MSDKQSLFITVYEGQDTANQVYDTLRGLEKDDKIDIKTAATVTRKENGKLKLKHKRRLTVWKGAFGGGIIALLIAGTGGGAVLGGAVVGALLGATRSKQRRHAKEFLEDKLGPEDSALVILVKDADWTAVQDAVEHYGGEEVAVELTPEAEKQLAALAQDEAVVEAVTDQVEVEVEHDEEDE